MASSTWTANDFFPRILAKKQSGLSPVFITTWILSSGVSIFSALQEQLGLKLVSEKALTHS